jgi:DeoR family glycerol-3-phosphate regulon repressor
VSNKTELRQTNILSVVRQRGYAAADDLAEQLGVTVQTIRRDINALADAGRLSRHHGGAGLPSSIKNIEYAERQIQNRREKEAIARMAAAEIPDRSSLFINIGTSTEAFAHALLGHKELHVITNNLNVAQLLARNTEFKVIVVGGVVRNRDGGVLGQTACDTIGQFRVDFGIIGISGIDEDGILLDFDDEEIRAARTILKNSRKVYLLADHTKFARRPMVRMGALDEISSLFTDRPPPPRIVQMARTHGVSLHICPPGPASERKQ